MPLPRIKILFEASDMTPVVRRDWGGRCRRYMRWEPGELVGQG